MSSHSRALQTASELETSRSAPTVKCPPKQLVTRLRADDEPGTSVAELKASSNANALAVKCRQPNAARKHPLVVPAGYTRHDLGCLCVGEHLVSSGQVVIG